MPSISLKEKKNEMSQKKKGKTSTTCEYYSLSKTEKIRTQKKKQSSEEGGGGEGRRSRKKKRKRMRRLPCTAMERCSEIESKHMKEMEWRGQEER